MKRNNEILKYNSSRDLLELLRRMFWPDNSWRVMINPSGGDKRETKPDFHKVRVEALKSTRRRMIIYHFLNLIYNVRLNIADYLTRFFQLERPHETAQKHEETAISFIKQVEQKVM
jgi:hypothetical protein